jgi:F-type H+-transporting ATPase subunit b
MPQIAQIAATYASQIFWLVIIFALIYVFIGRGMLPKIEATVEMRDRKIADDLAAAQAARANADALEAAHRAKIDAARGEATQAAQAAKSAAAAETEKAVKAADAVLAREATKADASVVLLRDRAMGKLEAASGRTAQMMVRKVANLTVEDDVAESATQAVMARG